MLGVVFAEKSENWLDRTDVSLRSLAEQCRGLWENNRVMLHITLLQRLVGVYSPYFCMLCCSSHHITSHHITSHHRAFLLSHAAAVAVALRGRRRNCGIVLMPLLLATLQLNFDLETNWK